MKIIVGLGNPGEKYANTRHNLGFEVIDEFRRHLAAGSWQEEKKFKAQVLKINYQLPTTNYQLILARPLTYMNNSGLAVSKIANFYKIKPADTIIIHDDLDLLLGLLKLRLGGGAGGHHGIESIIEKLGTEKFIRIRLGIGNREGFAGEHKRVSFSAEDFVMESFLASEKSKHKAMIKKATKALEVLLKEGIERAQNQFH